jgi:thiol:disulfide interchange protein/DsbC/DsbD-like thiol-disulfide interchange protein
MLYYTRLFWLLILLTCPVFAFATPSKIDPVTVNMVAEQVTVQPGHPFWVALDVKLEKGWHVYWKNPGDAGIPLSLNLASSDDVKSEPLLWPVPEKFTVEEMTGFGYSDQVTLLTQMTPSASLKPGSEIQITGEVKWLVCSDSSCQPGSAPVSLKVKVEAGSPQMNEALLGVFKNARTNMPDSPVQVEITHKQGILELRLPSDLAPDRLFSGVSFFPEEQMIIDNSVAPILTSISAASENEGPFIRLQCIKQNGIPPKRLKGVLVMHDGEGSVAFGVDSLIEDDSVEQFLSLSDDPMSSTQTGHLPVNQQKNFDGGLGLALLFAFMGGALLNLMPCVLPVMSFKVLSFVKMAGQSRSLTFRHGLFFSFGVILSFWVLAGIMLLLRAYGQAVGWGFQLQEPLFVVILATILFICALSLFGVFELGLFVSSWAGQTEAETSRKTPGYLSSFLSGVMATAVATPCTGPFLGTAVGFAVTLPVFQSLSIFTFLALGMCSPYLILAAFPACLRFIPKPGPWMETFKHLMGFVLMATVLWLLWVFSAQTNSLSLIFLLAGFLLFSVAAWLYGQGASPAAGKSKRLITYVAVALIFLLGCRIIAIPQSSWYSDQSIAEAGQQDPWSGWETFSPERVAELQKAGTPILIDFTAKWCLICQANHVVLASEQVNRKLNDLGVVKLKADWTRNDPVITEELAKLGRTSVPLYVMYGKGTPGQPLILPQILTPGVVLEHLEQANGPSEIALK